MKYRIVEIYKNTGVRFICQRKTFWGWKKIDWNYSIASAEEEIIEYHRKKFTPKIKQKPKVVRKFEL